MEKKKGVFTPNFVSILFVIAGMVFLYLKGKINTYVGSDGLLHEGNTLIYIGVFLIIIGIFIWLCTWLKNKNR